MTTAPSHHSFRQTTLNSLYTLPKAIYNPSSITFELLSIKGVSFAGDKVWLNSSIQQRSNVPHTSVNGLLQPLVWIQPNPIPPTESQIKPLLIPFTSVRQDCPITAIDFELKSSGIITLFPDFEINWLVTIQHQFYDTNFTY